MGPKSKGGKAVPKEEWSLCPFSGLLYHQEDGVAHEKWLENEKLDSPTHPHISGDQFTSRLVTKPRSMLGITLPESTLFSSIIISPAAASACKIGQGSIAKLSSNNCMVVQVFVSRELAGKPDMVCVPHSWPQMFANSSSLVTLAPLTENVQHGTRASVKPVGCRKFDARLRTAVKHHLVGLVLPECVNVPIYFYGECVQMQVTTGSEFVNSQSDISRELVNLRISPERKPLALPPNLTSTPLKDDPRTEISESGRIDNFFRLTVTTKIEFEEENVGEAVKTRFLGGLTVEMKKLREELSSVLHPHGDQVKEQERRRLLSGVLLFGPPGTGKTTLAQSIPALLGVHMVTVAGPELYSKVYGETEAQLRAKFEEARSKAPAVIFIDELDSVVPRREAGASDQERRVSAALQILLDRLGRDDCKVVVVGVTSKLENVDPALRRPGRLDLELEIGVPAVKARAEILTGILGEMKSTVSEDDLTRLARDTHGFVGADLESLVSQARLEAGNEEVISMEHLLKVRTRVKPSAMREVLVEVPEVTWADIGGLEELKLKLRQAVEWPVKHPEVFTRMGISAPRGLLMYGPPGCSKTMIAKALANESGLNFLSIKGPELFSKWVGESERAVREVFRRARQVKPSIVFFDEIDAIGGTRGGGAGKVGDRVLAQLLTEMDGVEGLEGVTVVAATNRPDMMDQALLRPGRLDRVVYVPLPDLETRRQVLKVHTRKIPLATDVNLEEVAQSTEGYSGAEVAAVCNEAALAALEESVDTQVVEGMHFKLSLQSIKPRISKELFTVYERFQASNASKKV